MEEVEQQWQIEKAQIQVIPPSFKWWAEMAGQFFRRAGAFGYWRGNVFFLDGGRRRRGQKIKVLFCPKVAKHLHQPEMFNRSRILHIL